MARKSRKHLQNATTKEQKPSAIEKLYIAGIYVRTSSHEQSGDSIENQRNIAEKFIQENPDIEFRKVYVDYGISSFGRFRPGFDEMLLDIESKSINCIIVKDVSRFTRDYIEVGDYLQRKFPLWGVRFISVNDNFDSLNSDATQLRISLWSLLSYQYSIDLSKNIQKAIAVKQEKGTYIPAKLPYGYRKLHTKQSLEWIPDEQTAPIVQFIFKNALSGFSSFAIASKLNELKIPAPSSEFWSSGGITRVLKNMSYVGTFVTGKTRNNIIAGRKTKQLSPNKWIKHYDHHTPIIDETTFQTVQLMLSNHRSFASTRDQSEDFFCGKLYCGICGRKMRLKHSVNGNKYYICPQKDEASSSCPNKARSESKLKKQVLLSLTERIHNIQICYQDTIKYEKSPYFLRKMDEQAEAIEVYEQELERQFQVFKRLYEDSIIKHTIRSADIQELLRHLLRVRTTLQERLAYIVRTRDEYWDKESSSARKFQLYQMFHECSELTPKMLGAMVEKVFVDMYDVRMIVKS